MLSIGSCGKNIYANNELVFRLQDGFHCFDWLSTPLICFGLCGCIANCFAPYGCLNMNCGLPFTCYGRCTQCCRHTQFVSQPWLCGFAPLTGIPGFCTAVMKPANKNKCLQWDWHAENCCIEFPEHKLFNDNLDNRILFLSAVAIQYAHDNCCKSKDHNRDLEQLHSGLVE